ncbi:hypothetical protein DL93DRAFT_2224603 [Clavulina sp. PMI_390]|nr:hypothetical protein DL93DRAFT_2224603 [Clavulina sp. PMI_390]
MNLPVCIDLRSLQLTLHSPARQIFLRGLPVVAQAAQQPELSREHIPQELYRHTLSPQLLLQGLDDEQLMLHAALARRKDRLELRMQAYERSAQIINKYAESYAAALMKLPSSLEPKQTAHRPNKFGLSSCDDPSSLAFNELEPFLDSYPDHLEALFEKWQDAREEIDLVTYDIDHLLAIAQEVREKESIREDLLRKRPSVNVVLEAEENGEVEVRFSYVVNGPMWSPAYAMNAVLGQDSDSAPSQIQLQSQAFVTQNTGEDWSNIKLVLSTAATGPLAKRTSLGPGSLATESHDHPVLSDSIPTIPHPPAENSPSIPIPAVAVPAPGVPEPCSSSPAIPSFGPSFAMSQPVPSSPVPKSPKSSSSESQPTSVWASNPASLPANSRPSIINQHISGEPVQNIEPNASNVGDLVQPGSLGAVPQALQLGLMMPKNLTASLPFVPQIGSSVIHVEGRGSIISGSSPQQVSIGWLTLGAQFTWAAALHVQDEILLECKVINTSDRVLLPGPCVTNVESSIVGQNLIPSVQPNESFSLTLSVTGAVKIRAHFDHQLKSSEPDASSSKQEPGTEHHSFSRRTTITNTYKFPITIVLRDRIPTSSDPNVKLLSASEESIETAARPRVPLTRRARKKGKGKEREVEKETPPLDPSWVVIKPGVTARWAPPNAEGGTVRSSRDDVIEWHCVRVKPVSEVETELAWNAVVPQGHSVGPHLFS